MSCANPHASEATMNTTSEARNTARGPEPVAELAEHGQQHGAASV